jgi:hypothetical protein
MKIGPQILRCRVCSNNPVFTVHQTNLGTFEINLYCSHPGTGGQESRISTLANSRKLGTFWTIHDWNYCYGKGYGP